MAITLNNKKVPISVHYFSSSRCMPIYILVGKVVLLVCIKSALIMSFPARTVNKRPLNNSDTRKTLAKLRCRNHRLKSKKIVS